MRSLLDKKAQKKKELSSPTSHNIFLLITSCMGCKHLYKSKYV